MQSERVEVLQNELIRVQTQFSNELYQKKNRLIELECQLSMTQKLMAQLQARLQQESQTRKEAVKRANEIAYQFQSKLTEKENILLNFQAEKQKEFSSLETELTQLKSSLKESYIEVEALKQTCISVMLEKNQLTERVLQLQKQTQNGSGQNSYEYYSMKDKLAQMQQQHLQEIGQKLSSLEEKESENQLLREKISTMYEQYHSRLKDMEDQYQSQIEEAQNNSLQRQNSLENNYELTISDLQEKNTILSVKNKEIQLQIAKFRREKEEEGARAEQERQAGAQKGRKVKQLELRLAEIEKELEKERSQGDRVQSIRAEMQKKVLQTDLQKKRLVGNLAELESRVQQLQQDNFQLRGRLKEVLSNISQENKGEDLSKLSLQNEMDELSLSAGEGFSFSDQKYHELESRFQQLEKSYKMAVHDLQKARAEMLALKCGLQQKIQAQHSKENEYLTTITKLQTEFLRSKLSSVEQLQHLKEENRLLAMQFGKKEERMNQKLLRLQDKLEKATGKAPIFRTYVTNFK